MLCLLIVSQYNSLSIWFLRYHLWHSSKAFKSFVESSEENEVEPVIQLLYENTDESSTVRSIDIHPSASFNGEYCELRSGKLTSFKEGFVWRLLILNFKSQFHPSFIAEIGLPMGCGRERSILLVSTWSAVAIPSCILHGCKRVWPKESHSTCCYVHEKSNAAESLECAFWRAHPLFHSQLSSTRKFISVRCFFFSF